MKTQFILLSALLSVLAHANSARQRPAGNGRNSLEQDLTKIIKNIPSEAEYGYYSEVQQFHMDLNTQDISLNYSAVKDTLVFSMEIPKNIINSHKNIDFLNLSIGIFTNTPEKIPKMIRKKHLIKGLEVEIGEEEAELKPEILAEEGKEGTEIQK